VKAWISILTWLLRIFIGPKPKSPRVTVVVKDETVIAEERKHLEELKNEVRRIEHELKELAPQATAAITARDGPCVIKLNKLRNKLLDELDSARQRKVDFERSCREAR